MTRILCLVCLFLTVASAIAQLQPTISPAKVVGPGVTWRSEFYPEGPLNYNVLKVQIDNPHTTIEAESGKDRLFAGEGVLDSVQREEVAGSSKVIGGVNADFWSNTPRRFWPVGLLVADGMIYNMPSRSRSAFVLTQDERPYIGVVSLNVTLTAHDKTFKIDRINSETGSNETILYTPPYGDEVPPSPGKRFLLSTSSAEFLPNQPLKVSVATVDAATTTSLGPRTFVLHVPNSRNTDWSFTNKQEVQLLARMPEVSGVVASVTGGGPSIVNDGKVQILTEREKVGKSFSETKHPRTAVGFTKDKKTIYLVTVDGRQPRVSVGASLEELGAYMVQLGCWQALNLDGGGSTTMVVGEKVVNRPSDFGGPRTVANSLLVVASNGAGEPSVLSFDPSGEPLLVPAGSTLKISVSAMDSESLPTALGDPITVDNSSLLKDLAVEGSTVTLSFSDLPKLGQVTMRSGAANGSLPVKIIRLEKVILEPEVAVLMKGQESEFHISAVADGKLVNLTSDMIKLTSADTSVAELSGNSIVAKASGETAIKVQVGSAEMELPVYVDMARIETIEDFDSTDDLSPIDGTAYSKSATILQAEMDNHKQGNASTRLNYQMERGGSTRINVPIGTKITEEPAALAVWIYGDGKEAWVRANLVDSNGVLFIADFTDGADGITWEGEWRRKSVSFQSLIGTDFAKSPRPKLPLTVREVVLAQDQEALKASGSILLDGLDALYPPKKDN